MKAMRWLVKKVLPKEWAEKLERESRTWFLLCECGFEQSVWDAGGIRTKATSKGKRILGKCPKCDALKWLKVHQRKK